MEENKNYRMGVSYSLYTCDNDTETLEEKTNDGEPFRFLTGFGMTLADFEAVIAPLNVGDTFDFTIPSERAYGEYHDDYVIEVEKDMFVVNGKFDDEHVREGAIIPLQNADGQRFMGQVSTIGADKVTLDLNHPLAGQTLHFKGSVVEKVEASAAEIQAMMAHLAGEGCGGCGGGCNGGNCGDGGCGGCAGCK